MIYSQAFWRNGLGGAYYDPRKLTDEMIRCYRWPAQVRGADRGVANFCLAQFAAMRYEMRARLEAAPRSAGACGGGSASASHVGR